MDTPYYIFVYSYFYPFQSYCDNNTFSDYDTAYYSHSCNAMFDSSLEGAIFAQLIPSDSFLRTRSIIGRNIHRWPVTF